MTVASPGLTGLDDVQLSPEHQGMFDLAVQSSRGPRLWRLRKQHEARRLLALAQTAGASRMNIMMLDLDEDLRAVFRLRVPVALRPGPDGKLRTADEAVLGMKYPPLALTVPLPGFFAVSLLHPAHDAFYPNVSDVGGQRLCLGAQMPVGIPVTELVILTYGLLGMLTVQLDSQDPAGVMNIEAAEWWQQNQHLMPLTREPFIREDPDG